MNEGPVMTTEQLTVVVREFARTISDLQNRLTELEARAGMYHRPHVEEDNLPRCRAQHANGVMVCTEVTGHDGDHVARVWSPTDGAGAILEQWAQGG